MLSGFQHFLYLVRGGNDGGLSVGLGVRMTWVCNLSLLLPRCDLGQAPTLNVNFFSGKKENSIEFGRKDNICKSPGTINN